MHKRGPVFLFLVLSSVGLLIVVGVFSAETVPYTASDSCVSCHIDEEVIASEYTPEEPAGDGG